jgi:hypothetical protein
MIECTNCMKRYIGSTSRTTRVRIREHHIDINQALLKTIVVEHFNQICKPEHFSFSVLHHNIDDETARLALEFKEIQARNTAWPFGLNQRAPPGLSEHQH